MFKIGDWVKVNDGCNYSITAPGSIGKVTEILKSHDKKFGIEVSFKKQHLTGHTKVNNYNYTFWNPNELSITNSPNMSHLPGWF